MSSGTLKLEEVKFDVSWHFPIIVKPGFAFKSQFGVIVIVQTFCLDQIDPFQRRPSLGPETGQKAWTIRYSFGIKYVADVVST